MRMPKFPLLSALAGALTLVACGDGSVRSPGLIGSGELQNASIECRSLAFDEPTFSSCSGIRTVNVGQSVEYRVVGNFEDGSEQVVTDRFAFSTSDSNLAREQASNDPNIAVIRAEGNSDDMPPVQVLARDRESEVDDLTSGLRIRGATPDSVGISRGDNPTNSCPDLTVTSGIPTQLFAVVRFEESGVPPAVVTSSNDPASPGNITWSPADVSEAPDSEINADTGVLTAINPNKPPSAEPVEIDISVSLTPRTEGPDFNVNPRTCPITVLPAQYVDDSFRIRFDTGSAGEGTDQTLVPRGGTTTVKGFATFVIGEDPSGAPVTDDFEVTQGIDDSAFTVSDTDVLEVVPSDNAVNNEFLGGETGTADIDASFRGDDGGPITAEVVEEDIGQLRLLPLAGDDATEFGLTSDGRLPCAADPDTCPDESLSPDNDGEGALPANATMPGTALAYRVVAVLEGQEDMATPDLAEAGALFPLGESVRCGVNEGATLNVRVDATSGGDNIDVLRTRTSDGDVVYEVTGLGEGSGTVTARVGRALDGSASEGVNCAGRGVEDATQDIEVGFPETAQQNQSLLRSKAGPVDSVTLGINTTSACVGYVNAVDLLTAQDARGRQQLLATATYRQGERKLVIPVNQQRRVQFGTQYGTADNERDGDNPKPQEVCDGSLIETFQGDFAELPDEFPAPDEFNEFTQTNSPVRINNDRGDVPRGLMVAQSPVSLGTACTSASFNLAERRNDNDEVTRPAVRIGGSAQEDQARTATITALPVADEDISRGNSFLSDDEIDGACGALNPVFNLLPGADENLVIDLLNLLGSSAGLILNNEIANDLGDQGGQALLEGLGILIDGVLAPLGLTDVFDGLFGVLGLGDNNPLPSPANDGTAVVTLLDALTQAIREGNQQLGDPQDSFPEGFSFEDLLEELENAQP